MDEARLRAVLTTLDQPISTTDLVVLVHSPIVGPSTWEPVARELRRRGYPTMVPDLGTSAVGDRPYWEQHSRAVVDALRDVPRDRRVFLVGHSGAGALLPGIGHEVSQPIGAYVFVDAGIPVAGGSRADDGPFADYLRELYGTGGRYPNWTEAELRETIPDAEWRRLVLAELRPPPLAFWEEPIPVFDGWPNAPAAFLRFTPNQAYDEAAIQARRLGWGYAELTGGHFHLLVDPGAVADTLLQLTGVH